jgi:SAM dependent carboxyl methyltransferase
MIDQPTPATGGMESGGAYNKHAKLQAGGSAFALPHWERAVRSAVLGDEDQPIVVADYGSSQGKNSLAPMRIAIEALRSRLGLDRSILICHIDLAVNDFNALLTLLEADPDCYSRNEPNVYSCAVGRSFYEAVLPPNYVHVGWCSYSAMWISRIPTQLPGHIFVPCSSGLARAAFERQAAHDWETFLTLRANELRPGGRLVVVVPGANEDGSSGFENIMNHANIVLTEMVDEGAITADELRRMALGVLPRRRRDLLAPFAAGGQFRNLIVESCETSPLADPAWVEYQRDGNTEAIVNKHAGFYRSTFVPSLASALKHAHDVEARCEFTDRLERGMKRRLVSEPAPVNSLVETIVLAKQVSE